MSTQELKVERKQHEQRVEQEIKENNEKSILGSDIDPSQITSSTTKELEEAEKEGFKNVDLPPGSFGFPMIGEAPKIISMEGYDFFTKKAQKEGTKENLEHQWAPVVKTHIFGERAILICGVEETKLFYDTSKVTRAGALTPHLKKYFFGEDTMINFDGEEHRHRKKAVMEFFTPQMIEQHMLFFGKLLDKYMRAWAEKDEIVIRDEMLWLHCEFSMGIFLGIFNPPKEEVKKRAMELNYIIESFGSVPLPIEVPGTRISRAGKARRSLMDWLLNLIKETKSADKSRSGSYIARMVDATDLEGNPIPEEIFASELINMLRPTTLASYFQVFLMHAIHENSNILNGIREEVKRNLSSNQQSTEYPYYATRSFLKSLTYTEYCAKEIRRFYPCIPLLCARVKEPFEYKGMFFPKEYLLILGIHAVHRDPRVWSNPDTFDPLRFERKEHQKCDERFSVVQHGGGDIIENHKCGGEELATLMIISFAARMAVDFNWRFKENQDFDYSMKLMPTLPKDGIVLENFSRVGASHS
jgi:fatty-acid peroxygenase